MQTIQPFLWFVEGAEEAAAFSACLGRDARRRGPGTRRPRMRAMLRMTWLEIAPLRAAYDA